MILAPVLMINILKNLKKFQNNTKTTNFRKKRNKNFPCKMGCFHQGLCVEKFFSLESYVNYP